MIDAERDERTADRDETGAPEWYLDYEGQD